MEYKIVQAPKFLSTRSALEKLVRLVNEAISLGWEPVGAPLALDSCLVQAMVKRR
jgi:hypothetical protein